jgi:putative addiction module component (TIGR02574 family)
MLTAMAADVRALAMQLPEAERLALAHDLLDSIEGPPPAPGEPTTAAEWDAELSRRVASVRDGSATTYTWAEVKAQLASDRLARAARSR